MVVTGFFAQCSSPSMGMDHLAVLLDKVVCVFTRGPEFESSRTLFH